MDSVFLTDLVLLTAVAGAVLVLCGHVTIENGLIRAKHSVNAVVKALVQAAIAVIATWLIGAALWHGPSAAGLVGTGFSVSSTGPLVLAILFGMTGASVLAGPGAERMATRAYVATVTVFVAIALPLALHASIGGTVDAPGLLRAAGFVDMGGLGVLHVASGAAGLALALMTGVRTGRVAQRRTLIQSQTFAFVALGGLMTWLGWITLTAVVAMSLGVPPGPILLAALCASAGGLLVIYGACEATPRFATTTLLPHGLIVGVVVVSASTTPIAPWLALALGALAAALVLAFRQVTERLGIDDAVGLAVVHLVGGMLGLGAAGFAHGAPALVQIGGVALLAAGVFGLIAALLWGLRRVMPVRVSPDAERVGLNVAEHGMVTDVAMLMAQMSATRDSMSTFGFMEADVDGEVAQVAREYNRAVDLFRTQVDALRNELSEAQTHAETTSARNDMLAAELAIKDDRLQAAAREVSALTEQIGRAMTTVTHLNGVREGMVRLLNGSFRRPIDTLMQISREAAQTRDPLAIERLIMAAQDQAQALARRLSDVVDFAEASGLDVLDERDRKPVPEIIESLMIRYRARAIRRDVRFRAVWEPAAGPHQVHAGALMRALDQLISVALETTERGGFVSVLARQGEADTLLIEVVDTGSGLSAGAIAAALDPFNAPADAGEPRVSLALAKRLAELMGGSLAIRSKPGVGTQAGITLPGLAAPKGLAA